MTEQDYDHPRGGGRMMDKFAVSGIPPTGTDGPMAVGMGMPASGYGIRYDERATAPAPAHNIEGQLEQINHRLAALLNRSWGLVNMMQNLVDLPMPGDASPAIPEGRGVRYQVSIAEIFLNQLDVAAVAEGESFERIASQLGRL